MVPYLAVTRRAQILIAGLVALYLAGCGEDHVVDLRILPPSGTCPDLGAFGAYVVLTWEGDEFAGCAYSACPPGTTQPAQCLAGVETDAVVAGKAFRVKALLFGSPPTGAPVLCGEVADPSADLETDILDIKLECAETCVGQPRCDPTTCWNEQKQFCPEFHP